MLSDDRLALVRAWRAEDPDQATGAALDHLVERAQGGDPEALAEVEDAVALLRLNYDRAVERHGVPSTPPG